MNDQERNEAAEEFLEQLRTSPNLFHKWMATSKDDAVAIGSLVREAVGLDETPTVDDLRAMSDHIAPALRKHVQSVQTAAVSWTGAMFETQSPL